MARVSRALNNHDYFSNGVSITPTVLSAGETAKVIYDGILAKSGASQIYAKVGFGNKWDEECYFPMYRTHTGFETTIPLKAADTLNLVFKDSANNWDNNSGKNYSFDVMQ